MEAVVPVDTPSRQSDRGAKSRARPGTAVDADIQAHSAYGRVESCRSAMMGVHGGVHL
jgi:hypothetical protein